MNSRAKLHPNIAINFHCDRKVGIVRIVIAKRITEMAVVTAFAVNNSPAVFANPILSFFIFAQVLTAYDVIPKVAIAAK